MLNVTEHVTSVGPSNYVIPAPFIESLLKHQLDKVITWTDELEETLDEKKFIATYNKILGSLIILADIWSVFDFFNKTEALSKRLSKIRTTHKLKHLL